jgi:hypothetical protein
MVSKLQIKTLFPSLIGIAFFLLCKRVNFILVTRYPEPTSQIAYFFDKTPSNKVPLPDQINAKFNYTLFNMNTGNVKIVKKTTSRNSTTRLTVPHEGSERPANLPKPAKTAHIAPSSPTLDLIVQAGGGRGTSNKIPSTRSTKATKQHQGEKPHSQMEVWIATTSDGKPHDEQISDEQKGKVENPGGNSTSSTEVTSDDDEDPDSNDTGHAHPLLNVSSGAPTPQAESDMAHQIDKLVSFTEYVLNMYPNSGHNIMKHLEVEHSPLGWYIEEKSEKQLLEIINDMAIKVGESTDGFERGVRGDTQSVGTDSPPHTSVEPASALPTQ